MIFHSFLLKNCDFYVFCKNSKNRQKHHFFCINHGIKYAVGFIQNSKNPKNRPLEIHLWKTSQLFIFSQKITVFLQKYSYFFLSCEALIFHRFPGYRNRNKKCMISGRNHSFLPFFRLCTKHDFSCFRQAIYVSSILKIAVFDKTVQFQKWHWKVTFQYRFRNLHLIITCPFAKITDFRLKIASETAPPFFAIFYPKML